jgi:hypothetical protein
MKSKFLLLPLLLSTSGPALAWPYAVRTVLTGMDNASTTGTGGARFDQPPVAVDFAASGRKPWYAGGLLMSNAPFPGSLTLPAILLPQTPAATVREMASAVCDVDGDGDMDVVRANEWVGNAMLYTFQVFLNGGSGTFTAGYRFDWVDNPSWNEGQHFLQLCAGDFNSDGRPDIAVLESYNNRNTTPNPDRDEGRLFIRWNDGAGQFATTTTVKSTGLAHEARLSAADCDRDGDLDLACTRDMLWPADDASFYVGVYSSRLFRNDGSGIFTQSNLSDRPGAFADVNRDGWPDLVSSTAVALNDGSGSFAATVEEVSGEVAAWTHADADGDGIVDLIRAEGTSLVHYKGAGNGTFAASWSRLVTLPAGATAVSAGDSDGDGDLDFFASLSDGTFAFAENRRLHTVPALSGAGSAAVTGITALQSADFNLDGIPDVAGLAPASNSFWIAHGKADGSLDAPLSKLTGGQTPHSLAVADFDRDGFPDVAYSRPAAGDVRLAHNNGSNPAFWPETSMITGVPGISQLSAGNFGSAGKFPDLLTSNATTGQVRWIYWNNTDWFYQTAYTASPACEAILSAHVTPAGTGHEILYQQPGTGSRTLGARQLSPAWGALGSTYSSTLTGGPHAAKMVWADTTGDGKSEVVFINGSGGLSTWNPLNAAVTTLLQPSGVIRDIVAGDFDRNGRDDILCATSYGLELVYWTYAGLTWRTIPLVNRTSGFWAVQVLDLNRDGWPDAAASSASGVHTYVNRPRLLQTGYALAGRDLQLTGGVNQTETLHQMSATTAGRAASAGGVSADVNALITGAGYRFVLPPVAGSGLLYGPGLTASELASLVTVIRFKANGLVVDSAGPEEIEAGGSIAFPYNQLLGNLVSVAPATPINLTIEVVFRSDAHLSSIREFHVVPTVIWSVPNDGLTTITPGAGQSSDLTNSGGTLITLSPPRTPLELWRYEHFSTYAGTGTAANEADYDRDGVPNLVEYFTGTNPTTADPALNAFVGLTLLPGPDAQTPVSLRVFGTTTALADPKLRVTIQYATGNLNAWSLYATRTGGGSWTGVTLPTVMQPVEGRSNIFFTTPIKPQFTPKYFVRLKVEELP